MLYKEPNQLPGFRLPKEENSLKNQMVAISRSLAKTQINWTPTQKKLFVMCLTKIDWSKSGNANVVELDKKEIINALGSDIDSNHQSEYLRNEFQKLAHNSEVHWTDPEDKNIWEDGFLIIKRASTKYKMKITFNPDYMPQLENLIGNYPFLTVWSNDIYTFKSSFTFALFEDLRLHYDSRYFANERGYTTKQLKELFGLSKNDYVKSNGKFDRYNFEKRTIETAEKEINAGEMMKIVSIEKIKKNGMVAEYRFRYFVKTRTTPTPEQLQAMAEDEEMDRLQERFSTPEDLERYNKAWKGDNGHEHRDQNGFE